VIFVVAGRTQGRAVGVSLRTPDSGPAESRCPGASRQAKAGTAGQRSRTSSLASRSRLGKSSQDRSVGGQTVEAAFPSTSVVSASRSLFDAHMNDRDVGRVSVLFEEHRHAFGRARFRAQCP
jgi:hypothetical protein